MGIKISWHPSTEPDIASYILERAPDITGSPFVFLAQINHQVPGPNYDPVTNTLWYLDETGDTTKFYRLISVDAVNQQSIPSTPFQAHSATPVPPNNVKVDHNYPTPGNLRYQTTSGLPIEAAYVRVYKKADFDQGRTDVPLAITMTNAQGNWVNPISLTTGFTYVVQFAKESLYGPDKAEIVV